ncbi:MAG TPA: hypothetical protein VLI94_13775 [Solirubrobacterales bacterium]|nr:hypothetical protein [Solirubrobacterales bacterium]
MSVIAPLRGGPTEIANPLGDGPTVLVTAVAEAEGSRGAAAALACAGADAGAAGLFVDVGGRAPRPTLIISAAAQKLEERLAAHLPQVKVAGRGQVCHLAVSPDLEGLTAAAAAIAVARGATAAVHVPPQLLQPALERSVNLRPSGVLLRADLQSDRALVALTARELIERGLAIGVLKRRLGWVAERRALFGVLPAGSPGGLPQRLVRRLSGASE